jgi:hypothetical protein
VTFDLIFVANLRCDVEYCFDHRVVWRRLAIVAGDGGMGGRDGAVLVRAGIGIRERDRSLWGGAVRDADEV